MIYDSELRILFGPLASLVGGLLGVTLAILLAIARFNLVSLRQSVLFKRWCVWSVVALVYAAAVLAGAVGVAALAAFIAWQGLREYAHLVRLPRAFGRLLAFAGLLAGPAAVISPDLFYRLPALLLLAGTLQPLLGSGRLRGDTGDEGSETE